jgi:hypothetical protein
MSGISTDSSVIASSNKYYPSIKLSTDQLQKMGILEATSLAIRVTALFKDSVDIEYIWIHYHQGIITLDSEMTISLPFLKHDPAANGVVDHAVTLFQMKKISKFFLDGLWNSVAHTQSKQRSKNFEPATPAFITATLQKVATEQSNIFNRLLPDLGSQYVQLREMGIMRALGVSMFIEPSLPNVTSHYIFSDFQFDRWIPRAPIQRLLFCFNPTDQSVTSSLTGVFGLQPQFLQNGTESAAAPQQYPQAPLPLPALPPLPLGTASVSATASGSQQYSHVPLPLPALPPLLSGTASASATASGSGSAGVQQQELGEMFTSQKKRGRSPVLVSPSSAHSEDSDTSSSSGSADVSANGTSSVQSNTEDLTQSARKKPKSE